MSKHEAGHMSDSNAIVEGRKNPHYSISFLPRHNAEWTPQRKGSDLFGQDETLAPRHRSRQAHRLNKYDHISYEVVESYGIAA